MRKCIILNNLDLTSKKSNILNIFVKEYLRVIDAHLLQLPLADSSNELHHLTYLDIRKTSFLPSDVIQEARKDVWKVRKHIINKDSLEFNSCSIRLNKRWFRYIKSKRGNPCFKITYSPEKAFAIPIRMDRQFQRFNSFLRDEWTFDNISLLKDGRISVILEKEFPSQKSIIGMSLGLTLGLPLLRLQPFLTSKLLRSSSNSILEEIFS